GTFLESNLERMVPGVRDQLRQSVEAAVELGERLEQQLLRNRGIDVTGVRHVSGTKNRAGGTPRTGHRRTRPEKALGRIRHFCVEIIRYPCWIKIRAWRVDGRILCGLYELISNRRR